jgi:hypothetical protein
MYNGYGMYYGHEPARRHLHCVIGRRSADVWLKGSGLSAEIVCKANQRTSAGHPSLRG